MPQTDTRSTSPFASSFERLRSEMDTLLEAAWSNGERALGAFGLSGHNKHWIPAIDMVESDENVTVTVDVPGVDPQAVSVSLAGNMLTIKGERPALNPHRSEIVHLSERRRGEFHRSIPLPVPVNPNDICAESRNGSLIIRLAKQETVKPRHIPITPQSAHESAPTPLVS